MPLTIKEKNDIPKKSKPEQKLMEGLADILIQEQLITASECKGLKEKIEKDGGRV